MARFFQIFSLFLFLVAVAPAHAQDAARHVQIKLVPQHTTVAPGEAFYIAIEQTIEPGWHTYWHNPGDSGEAPRIKWTLPDALTAGEILWPVPKAIPIGPLTNFGYEGNPVILQMMQAADALPDGPLTVRADIEILVCADICIPEYGTYEVTLNDGVFATNSEIIDRAFAELPARMDLDATFTEEGGDFVLRLPAEIEEDLSFIPYEWGLINNAASVRTVREDGVTILRHPRGDRPLSAVKETDIILLSADAGLIVSARRDDLLTSAAVPDPVPADRAAPVEAPVTTPAQTIGLAQALLFAVLGGMILNLMPCVFPVLSMKALKLVSLSGRDLGHARLHSLLYMLGILVSFLALAVLLLALKAAGAQIGWGFHLQNPVFVLLLSYLLFLIGLNLSGFFDFTGRFANIGGKLAGSQGYAGSFFTGVLAAVVATPCTAPFMGVAMGFALTQPAAVTLVVFAALGFGLALPYMLIALSPPLRRLLPRPGLWMVTFKQFLAFPLYASAAWLLWVYSMQDGALGVFFSLSGLIAIAFGLWLLQNLPAAGVRRFLVILLALVTLLLAFVPVAASMRPALPAPVSAEATTEGWIPFTADGFAALEKGDRPLFVDMTAAWCITCKVNERLVLNTPAGRALFVKHDVVTVQGDWTDRDAAITDFLASYGRNGVPIYVYYGPRDPATGQRPTPVVLPQILTPAILEKTLAP